jgi:hypothetical protein
MRALINFREDGCWEWESYRSPLGYGRCQWNGRPGAIAHRVLFEALNGPLSPGLEVDHLCKNKACIRPDHLEAVTRDEHARRHPLATRTLCAQGHEYTPGRTAA